MKVARLALGGILALSLLLASAAGLAVGERGAGVLLDVDSEKGTVTFGKHIYRVEPTTELYDGRGARISIYELESYLGEWAWFRGSEGNQGLILEALQVAPDDD